MKWILLEHHPHDSRINIVEDGICQSLTQKMGTGGGNVPLVIEIRTDEEDEEEGERNMLHIKFEYMDAYSNGNWNRQECTVESVDKCIELYGLGKDCDYRIISVEEVSGDNPLHNVG